MKLTPKGTRCWKCGHRCKDGMTLHQGNIYCVECAKKVKDNYEGGDIRMIRPNERPKHPGIGT